MVFTVISLTANILSIFLCVYLPSIFFGEVFKSFAHSLIGFFIFLLLTFKIFLYILDIVPLLHMWFCKYFLPLCGSSFSFLLIPVYFLLNTLMPRLYPQRFYLSWTGVKPREWYFFKSLRGFECAARVKNYSIIGTKT